MSIPSNVELLLCFNDNSEVALSIPLAECKRFAITPLKWLRFLGFAVYGRQGYLSTSMNSTELDYTGQITARSYYFLPDGEPRFVDVDALDNRTTVPSASELSTGRADFEQRVVERDGTCVMTGDALSSCHACHFIPRSKGDSYMSNLFNHRREAYGLVDPLNGVNDTRNGILLFCGFHPAFDASYIAFLKTPNFALTVDDIPYNQSANAGSPANRLTLQHMQPSQVVSSVSRSAPHNNDARQPQDIDQWPPAIIADFSYAVAALRAWGPTTFIQHVRANSKDSYYETTKEGEDEDATGGPISHVPRQPTYRGLRNDKARAVNPAEHPDMDMFDVVLSLWMRAAREGKKTTPRDDTTDVAESKSKVQTWLQSIAPEAED